MRLHTKVRPPLGLGECAYCGNPVGVICIHWEGKKYDSRLCWELAEPQLAKEFEDAESADRNALNGTQLPFRGG